MRPVPIHTHRRFTHRIRTGRPNAGASTRRTTTRPWACATTPQVGHPITAGSDSTVTVNAPPASRATALTRNPSKPTSRSHRAQYPPPRQHNMVVSSGRCK